MKVAIIEAGTRPTKPVVLDAPRSDTPYNSSSASFSSSAAACFCSSSHPPSHYHPPSPPPLPPPPPPPPPPREGDALEWGIGWGEKACRDNVGHERAPRRVDSPGSLFRVCTSSPERMVPRVHSHVTAGDAAANSSAAFPLHPFLFLSHSALLGADLIPSPPLVGHEYTV
jgi:hypothetical protein